MTQSGGRSAFDFIIELAAGSGMSQRAILREARARGIRIGNDIGRALIRSVRGQGPTAAQANRLVRLVPDASTAARRLGAAIGAAAGESLANALERIASRAMVRIVYTVTGTVGFIWNSGSAEDQTIQETITNEVTIRFTQAGQFLQRLPELGRQQAQRLVDQGLNTLGLDSNYGDGFIEGVIATEIVSQRVVGV